MISLKRLEQIQKHIYRTHYWEDGCTTEEREEINKHWKTMYGNTCFHHAVGEMIRERKRGIHA